MEAFARTAAPLRLKSIFTSATPDERARNFESYWAFSSGRDGEILEAEKDLTVKREILARYQANPVRSKKPLPDPELFYRNYVKLVDDPTKIGRAHV